MSVCCVRVGMPVDGPAALHVEDHRGDFGEIGQPDELLHQRDAGAGGAVNARAPFQAAPITMPIEASSSSAWTMANLFLPVSLDRRGSGCSSG